MAFDTNLFLLLVCFQSTAMAFDTVNEVNVYTCTGQPLRSDIANIVEWMLNEDFSTAYNSILVQLLHVNDTKLTSKLVCQHRRSPSLGVVDFAVWLVHVHVDCILNLPNGQVKFV